MYRLIRENAKRWSPPNNREQRKKDILATFLLSRIVTVLAHITRYKVTGEQFRWDIRETFFASRCSLLVIYVSFTCFHVLLCESV